jgi:hypothetical protein
MQRIEVGTVSVPNPFNSAQIRHISLLPDDVDCIVFWTKDPAPLLPYLSRLEEHYRFYMQFTLTPYGRILERRLRDKTEIVETFRALSLQTGKHRVRWRYDPVILNSEIDIPYHRRAFDKLCSLLVDCTEGVTISFVDMYKRLDPSLFRELTEGEMFELAAIFSDIAGQYGLEIQTCGEPVDLSPWGIKHGACVDSAFIETLIGRPLRLARDPYQRVWCGCCQSVDIGSYNTCTNGCVYCYANRRLAK